MAEQPDDLSRRVENLESQVGDLRRQAELFRHDAANGTELLPTLKAHFQNQGRLRPTAAQLYVHEHTLSYRLKRIEQLTERDLRSYRDAFELWLAVESSFLVEGE